MAFIKACEIPRFYWEWRSCRRGIYFRSNYTFFKKKSELENYLPLFLALLVVHQHHPLSELTFHILLVTTYPFEDSTQMENLPFLNQGLSVWVSPKCQAHGSSQCSGRDRPHPGGKHCSSQCSCGWWWWVWGPTGTGRVSYTGAWGPGRWYSGGPFVKRKE